MRRVDINKYWSDPLDCLLRVEAGESLLIVRHDLPVLEMIPAWAPGDRPRPFGLCAGEFTVPADFDAPLPEAILQGFEGS